jgi:hypothetical protein
VEDGLIVWVGLLRDNYLLVLQLFVGQFGLVEMILSLIKLQPKLFGMYYTKKHIDFGSDHD